MLNIAIALTTISIVLPKTPKLFSAFSFTPKNKDKALIELFKNLANVSEVKISANFFCSFSYTAALLLFTLSNSICKEVLSLNA